MRSEEQDGAGWPKDTPVVITCKYRNALMWTLDRLTVTNPTPKEIRDTCLGIGNVLMGRPSPAATYVPNEWDDSAKIDRHAHGW